MPLVPHVHGGAIQSPFVYDSGADANGKSVSITITFNNATRAITGGTLHRDPGCLYKHIYIGLGANGQPDSTTHTFNITSVNGDLSVTAGQLAAQGLNVIEDVTALGQITAGP
jgi:hypothetical protein